MHSITPVAAIGGNVVAESSQPIASDLARDTAVYNARNEPLGTVYGFMIDKLSGQVAYVVMSFGGFLGIGQTYRPLPWKLLSFDLQRAGFVVDVYHALFEAAPRFSAGSPPDWADRSYGNGVDLYNDLPPYWGRV